MSDAIYMIGGFVMAVLLVVVFFELFVWLREVLRPLAVFFMVLGG